MKKNIICLIITIILGAILYYFMIPPINLHSMLFWIYLSILIGFYALCRLCGTATGKFVKNGTSYAWVMDENNKLSIFDGALWITIGAIIVLIIIINFVLSPLFNAKTYSKRISVNEDSDFATDVKPVDFNTLPLLDKVSSQKLGDRVMGQMPELVSQFYVSDLYTQINYNNDIIRVTPLEYDGIIKYFTNRKDGVKGYITVNSVTGEAKLTKLDKGMKYMPSAIFGEDLDRKLRFSYPTKIFGTESFEIDNEGNPYWIVPTIKYAGVGLRRDVEGIIILDPITGTSKYYKVDEIPTWVDHVYAADMIIEQVNDWGQYRKGFINSLFGQKNVVATTEGYNYIAMNDDVYLYTGITSKASDESNIGFILTNMRTKETNFYSVPGAEEYSAMASAEGQVQQMKYIASFPLLVNLNNKPTYLISLKDNAGLVKMYAFVDVADYQKVTVTDSSKGIETAATNYLEEIGAVVEDKTKYLEKTITISSITTSTIDGNTYYYIIDNEGKKYSVSIKANRYELPFIKEGSLMTISYKEEKNTTVIDKVTDIQIF